jgi:hypothetical protein
MRYVIITCHLPLGNGKRGDLRELRVTAISFGTPVQLYCPFSDNAVDCREVPMVVIGLIKNKDLAGEDVSIITIPLCFCVACMPL